jgi:hypothetical protein
VCGVVLKINRLTFMTTSQLDEDVASEIQLIMSWMNGDQEGGEIGGLPLDPRRTAFVASLLNPPEYALPYLC